MATILIADDNQDERTSLAILLEAAGHKVTSVPNGREALAEVLQGEPPDVILLDLLMPQMDGPSFLQVVRSYWRLQSLPVVIITGAADSSLIDRAKELRVNQVLLKGKALPGEIRKALEDAVVQHSA